MKKRPTTAKESELRKRFENAHLETNNAQDYRELRRQLKKEMKTLERKKAKNETKKAVDEYLKGEQI